MVADFSEQIYARAGHGTRLLAGPNGCRAMRKPDKVADFSQQIYAKAGQGSGLFAGPNCCRSVQEPDMVADFSQGLMIAGLPKSPTR